MHHNETSEYVYLNLPPVAEVRTCVGLVLAGLVTRAKIGVGGLEEAVDLLESLHSGDEPTSYRFQWTEEAVTAEIEDVGDRRDENGESVWRTVVELVV